MNLSTLHFTLLIVSIENIVCMNHSVVQGLFTCSLSWHRIYLTDEFANWGWGQFSRAVSALSILFFFFLIKRNKLNATKEGWYISITLNHAKTMFYSKVNYIMNFDTFIVLQGKLFMTSLYYETRWELLIKLSADSFSWHSYVTFCNSWLS